MTKRKKYTKEFKEDAVNLIIKEGYSIAETAVNLDIHENMRWRWKKRI